jgi:hypothetical protein
MIDSPHLADVIARYQGKQSAGERTGLPRHPSPKRGDR